MFPIKLPDYCRSKSEVTIEEQTEIAIITQKYFADNAVSYTCCFKPSEADRLEELVRTTSSEMKCISAFPDLDTTTTQYRHLPFTPLNDEDFAELVKDITKVNWNRVLYPGVAVDLSLDVVAGCSSDSCERPRKK